MSPAENNARLRLEVVGNGGQAAELPAVGTLVVGSSRERAGFVVEGQGVDDTHFAIGRTKEGDWALKDLGSKNGTLVNGQRVSAARLKEGDQIVIGTRRLELRAPRAAPARTGRPADAPQRVGGYRVERLIGRGGMGAVYLAVQESLNRPVALKVLAPKLAADLDFVHRFQAEARAAAALSHPNVVVVYDVGEEAGSHYLSMEFMAGGSLEQKLSASGPLPWKSVLSVLHDAAAGLAYAESRGIVHRDIKPANLMYSGTGTVKIADLGLATTLEQEANLAEGGRKVYGTPHFISPEQARGEAVDHRSDLYSLGATAYRLISGHTPFEGQSSRDILRALQTEEPRTLRELVPDLAPELEGLITRLMAKEARARFPSAESLRRECERLRLVAEHGPTLERSSRVQAWIGAALLLVVGAAAAWYFLRPKEAQRGDGGRTAETDGPADAGGSEDTFFSGDEPRAPRPDEEGALRERERQAAEELRGLSPFLSNVERVAALQNLAARWSGTSAAASARAELASLAQPSAQPGLLESAVAELRVRVSWPPPEGELAPPAPALRALAEFKPPVDVASAFEPARASLERDVLLQSEAAVRAEFARARELGLAGDYVGVRAVLASLEPVFEGLDGLPGDAARLAPLLELRKELAARVAAVDTEERAHASELEHAARVAVAAALGPGSGVLAELRAADWSAVEARLAALAPELAARPEARTLAEEVRAARAATEALVAEFGRGAWRRKTVLDPRTKKPREVRDARPDGLVFDREGALESVPWSAAGADPDWWQQLFQGRLTRDWQPAEARGVAAVLRLAGAARAAELGQALLDPHGRGLLQPADLEALARVFDPAVQWLETGGLSELRPALEAEENAARLLSAALGAAQERAWSRATADLERCLGEGAGSVLVTLLSDGSEWRAAAAAGSDKGGR